MAILAEGLLLLLMVASLSAQYSSRYLKPEGVPSIIVGHRKEYLESGLENVPFRPYGHLRGYRKEEPSQFTEKYATADDENNREYTVGAHFQVTNYPNTSSYKYPPKQDKYKELLSDIYNKKSNTGKKALFKPYNPETENREQRILINPREPINYEPLKGIDEHPRNFKLDFELQDVPNLYPLQKQYQKVASKGQIQKFLEDQQKMLDESLELQLLNDPNPAAKGKYHQFLKAKDDERIEKEYEEKLRKAPTIVLDESISTPAQSNPFQRKKLYKHQQKGLGSYRTPKFGEAYKFTITY